MTLPAKSTLHLCLTMLLLFILCSSSAAADLKESVNRALAYNPDLKAMQESREVSSLAVDQAKAGRLPSAYLSAGGGFTQRSDTLTKAYDEENDWQGTGEYTVRLVQPLWHGGSIVNDIRMRELLFSSAEYQLEHSGVNMAYNAVAAHIDVLRRARLLELARINVSEHEKILSIMRQRYDSQVSTIGELSQVQNRHSRAIATELSYKTAYDNACSAYLRVTGQQPQNLSPASLPANLYPNLQDARSACLKGNLRIKSAVDALFATEKEKAIAESAFWPTLDLEVGHNWYDRAGDANESTHGLGAMLRLNWEFFSGWRDKAGVAMSAARIRQSKQALYALMDSLNEDVESSYHMYESAMLQELEYARAKEASIRTKEDYNRQFLSAKRSIVDVLDAESDFFYAASQEELSRHDKVLASYRLLALSGELLAEMGVNPASLRASKPTTSLETRNVLMDAPSTLNTLRTPQ